MMICPDCGQENRDVARFCQRCGASLSPTEPSITPTTTTDTPPAIAEDESLPAEPEVGEAPPTVEVQVKEELPAEPIQASPETEITAERVEQPEKTAEQTVVDAETEVETDVPPAILETSPEPAEVPSTDIETVPPDDLETALAPQTLEPTADDGAPAAEQQETGGEYGEPSAEYTAPADEYGEVVSEPQPQAVPDVPEAELTLDQEQDSEAEAAEVEPVHAPPQAPVDEAPLEEQAMAPLAETESDEALIPVPQADDAPERQTTDEYMADLQALASADVLPWYDGPEPLLPLDSGTVVKGRYQIVDQLSAEEQQVIYRIRDLQRCPQCGSTDNSPDEAFCSSCGAVMDRKPIAMMLERRVEYMAEPVEARVEDHFSDAERAYWVWREVKETAPLPAIKQAMRLLIGQKSDTGQVRELDEDSLFVLTMSRTHESISDQFALLVVADGMGGHEGGEIASRVAVQTLAEMLLGDVFAPELAGTSLLPEEICHCLVRAMKAANDRVYLERQKRQNDMGTTMTAALIKDWTLCLAHVGDCRAYLWSEEGLQQHTTDHSIVASMIAAGTAQPEEIYTHPQRSVIYRCVGDQPVVEVDTEVLALRPGDRLVLCCDGLWEMIHNEGIEDIMLRESDPQKACDTMVELANIAGGTDNISVIVAQLQAR
ncbi:MAG: protein phosphatase 2C domain-containing protein [Planctomycetota bacterium]|jgi:serine/threonine protein phosphatase PrpC